MSPIYWTPPARNGCPRTPEAHILLRGVITIPYHTPLGRLRVGLCLNEHMAVERRLARIRRERA
eukprot:6182867-Pleurochrysis_carterae.AAC.6